MFFQMKTDWCGRGLSPSWVGKVATLRETGVLPVVRYEMAVNYLH